MFKNTLWMLFHRFKGSLNSLLVMPCFQIAKIVVSVEGEGLEIEGVSFHRF